jgi:hypothetical protein
MKGEGLRVLPKQRSGEQTMPRCPLHLVIRPMGKFVSGQSESPAVHQQSTNSPPTVHQQSTNAAVAERGARDSEVRGLNQRSILSASAETGEGGRVTQDGREGSSLRDGC